MSAVPFADLPDHARLWVYAAARPLAAGEQARLLERADAFVERWVAHGAEVAGARDWRYDRFLLLAADEEATGVSGCSIDSMTQAIKAMEAELGLSLREAASLVWYRDAEGEIRSATRPDFRRLAEAGAVGPDTTVFDNTVPTVGALRAGGWERPLRESWHARAFMTAIEN